MALPKCHKQKRRKLRKVMFERRGELKKKHDHWDSLAGQLLNQGVSSARTVQCFNWPEFQA